MKFVRIFSKIRFRCIEIGNSNKHLFFIVKETIAYSSKITFTSKLSLCVAIKHLLKKRLKYILQVILFYTMSR